MVHYEPITEGDHRSESSNRRGELTDVSVLLVEDDDRCREALALALEERGAQVTAVDSVRAALERFDPSAPTVLISDIEMPGEDGFVLIQEVRSLDARHCRRTPAIAVTGLAVCDALRRAGFDDHIPKPVDLACLVERIRALVAA